MSNISLRIIGTVAGLLSVGVCYAASQPRAGNASTSLLFALAALSSLIAIACWVAPMRRPAMRMFGAGCAVLLIIQLCNTDEAWNAGTVFGLGVALGLIWLAFLGRYPSWAPYGTVFESLEQQKVTLQRLHQIGEFHDCTEQANAYLELIDEAKRAARLGISDESFLIERILKITSDSSDMKAVRAEAELAKRYVAFTHVIKGIRARYFRVSEPDKSVLVARALLSERAQSCPEAVDIARDLLQETGQVANMTSEELELLSQRS